MAKRTRKSKTKNVVDDVHQGLIIALVSARKNRLEIEAAINCPQFSKILGGYKTDIERYVQSLIGIEKKDLEMVQGRIMAMKELIRSLKTAYLDDVKQASKALEDFEKKNELFIAAAKQNVDQDTGEIEEA